MVKLGHVALDGTKIQANASVRKSMRYGDMKKAEGRRLSIKLCWRAAHLELSKRA